MRPARGSMDDLSSVRAVAGHQLLSLAVWTNLAKYSAMGFPNRFSVIPGWSVSGGPTMLTTMTDEEWAVVLRAFHASRSRPGDKGREDRKFLEALHYFVVHNITWRALPRELEHWNSVWKRFWRLSRAGVFEAFFD